MEEMLRAVAYVFLLGLGAMIVNSCIIVEAKAAKLEGIKHEHGTCTKTIVETITLPEAGLLTAITANGPITVTPWDKPEVQFTAKKHIRYSGGGLLGWLGFGRAKDSSDEEALAELFEEMKVEIFTDGSGARIESHVPRRKGCGLYVEYDLRVPKNANLALQTSNGAVSVSGIHGKVDARTSNGRVDCKDIVGPVAAHTSNGAIRCENVSGQVKAKTSNGAIDVVRGGAEFSEGGIDCETSNGRIQVTFAGPRLPQEGITCRTSNGAIVVALPADASFGLEARTSMGSIHSDFPVTVQGDMANKRVDGQVGAGGPPVILRTSNGAISLKKR